MQFDEESNEDVRKLCRYLHRNSMPCIIHAHVFGDDLQTEWNCIIGTESSWDSVDIILNRASLVRVWNHVRNTYIYVYMCIYMYI